jgi:hypothetical protein
MTQNDRVLRLKWTPEEQARGLLGQCLCCKATSHNHLRCNFVLKSGTWGPGRLADGPYKAQHEP